MAPVTRRRTKALEASQTDSSFISDAEPDSLANTPSQSQKSQDSTPRTKSGARSKRKSTDAGDGETAQKSKQETPKRKRLAVRTRVEESPKGDHRRVHIEATVLDSAERPETVADSDVEEDSDGGAPKPESATKQLQAEAIQKLASQSAEPEPAAPKGKHVVFGDDNDVDKFVAKAAAKDKRREADKENDDGDDDDDSDDEAPEAVSTAAAATQSKKVEQAATDAAEKLAAAQKRKRQERDARFREQAEERKRAEAEAKTARQRISKRDLPDILPAEFLEDSDSDSDSGAPDSHMRKLRKKRKLAEAEAEAALAASEAKRIRFEEVAEVADRAEAEAISHTQRPRDVMLGSTVYRVLAQQADQRLAPKMHKNARAVKDDLLKRKRGAFTTTKKKGFFVKK